MPNGDARGGIHRTLKATGLLLVGMMSGSGSSLMGDPTERDIRRHRVKSSLISYSSCSDEERAYLDAVAATDNAQDAEDTAYQEWVDCQNSGARPTTQEPPLSAEYSVLKSE